ncbi:MAG: hypothetical protein WCK93_09700 [Nitrosomonadales bacterium]
MIETATLITLCMLYLMFFRPGKTPPLDNPLVIERPGQYHLTLAPQLNLAQSFIEAIAERIAGLADVPPDTATRYFEVCDNQVASHGFDCYLLAITRRAGLLYIQAAPPIAKDHSNLTVISEFARQVLARFPDDEAHASAEEIVSAVQQASKQRGNQIKLL